MLDVVAPHNNELAPSVEIERINNSKPGRPGPAVFGQPETVPEERAKNKCNQCQCRKQGNCCGRKRETAGREKTFVQFRTPQSFVSSTMRPTTSSPAGRYRGVARPVPGLIRPPSVETALYNHSYWPCRQFSKAVTGFSVGAGD